jgi:hypothetical protein
VLKQLNYTIDWKTIEQLLDKFYYTEKLVEGGKAYLPLMLFKCLLLQKWFQIPSDPELESQINDRIFFKSLIICAKNGTCGELVISIQILIGLGFAFEPISNLFLT